MELVLDLADASDLLLYEKLSGEDIKGIKGATHKTSLNIGIKEEGIRILEVIIEGFGPHLGPNKVEIKDGLTILEGPNGSGKTHLLHSIYWALFGKTGNLDPWSRDLEENQDLVNWQRPKDRGMKVSLVISYGEEKFRVSRSYNGRESFKLEELEEGAWKESGKRNIIDPYIAPLLLYQGENSMFLTSADPFSEKGMLHRVLDSIIGAQDLERIASMIEAERELLKERMKGKNEKIRNLENELSELRSRKKELAGKVEGQKKRIISFLEDTKKARDDYTMIVGDLSTGDGGSHQEINGAKTAEMVGRIEERLSNAWSNAYVELLREQGERALKKAIIQREDSTRKRIMYGVHEAQQAIVEEILRRSTCICGTSIATTGMGRERLKHLHENLGERKKDVSDWSSNRIWCSDIMIGNASMELMDRGSEGTSVKELLKENDGLKRSISEIPFRKDQRTALIEAVRKHERSRIVLNEERSLLKQHMDRIEKVESLINDREGEFTRLFGGKGGDISLEDNLSNYGIAMNKALAFIELRIEKARSELEAQATIILQEISRDPRLFVKIHPKDMTIGRERFGENRVIPMNKLSAGERETLAISIIIGLSRVTGSGIIMDSPFTGMESDSIQSSMELLSGEGRNILLLVPSGSVQTLPEHKRRYTLVPGPKGTILQEEEK